MTERLGEPAIAVRMTPRGDPVEFEAADFDPLFHLALDPGEEAQLTAERAGAAKLTPEEIRAEWKRRRAAKRRRRAAR